ncbi:MAG: hypothetical protein KAJ19_11795, partial [Gammaproteobacteria bacterium]|nr:hypothetical protein [Gammaproteobacteria bacterium]
MTDGFFKEDMEAAPAREPVKTKDTTKKTTSKKRPLTCESCGAFENGICKSPQMDMNGSGHKKALILGELPGQTDDRLGKQLEGEAG